MEMGMICVLTTGNFLNTMNIVVPLLRENNK